MRPQMSNVLEHLLHFQHFQQFISARLASANSDSRVVYRDLFDDEVQALEDGEGAVGAVTVSTCLLLYVCMGSLYAVHSTYSTVYVVGNMCTYAQTYVPVLVCTYVCTHIHMYMHILYSYTSVFDIL